MAKHNKIKNVGVLFELLTRQITSDTLNGVDDSPAIKIVKEHFNKNSYLSKELNLYKALQEQKYKTSNQADKFIDIVIKEYQKLSRVKLNKAKYSVIKEIKHHYDLDNFFKSRVSTYRLNASIFNLLETSNKHVNPTTIMKSRTTLVEHITSASKVSVNETIEKVYANESKDVRLLAYKILLENFNKKYGTLGNSQKLLLKEYINNISNSNKLKSYMINEIKTLKTNIKRVEPKVDDKIVKIKLAEVRTQLSNIVSDNIIRDKHLVSMMRAYDLVKELKNVVK